MPSTSSFVAPLFDAPLSHGAARALALPMAAMQDATMIDKLKATYDMQPPPEGGFFKETMRAFGLD